MIPYTQPMTKEDFKGGEYIINGKRGFFYEEALRIWKAQYKTVDKWAKVNAKYDWTEPLATMVRLRWDAIEALPKEEMKKLFPARTRYQPLKPNKS